MTEEEQAALDLQNEADALEAERLAAEEAERQRVEAAATIEGVPSEPKIKEEPKPEASERVQKRFDQITRQRHDAERRVKELQDELAARPAAAAAEPKGKPTLEQYEYDDSRYIEALTDWKVDQALDNRSRQTAERQQQETDNKTAQDYDSKLERVIMAGISAHEDFEAVVINSKDLKLSKDAVEVLGDSEAGHEVAYYLANNLAEADRIFELSPLAQARELGKIEAALTMKPKKKATNAPEPIKTVGSRGASAHGLDPTLPGGKINPAWVKARNEGKI